MSTQQVVNELEAVVGGFTAKVNVKMDNVDETTERIKKTANDTYNEIKSFKQSMIENEQMQSAQENILRINQIIRERFSEHDDIRRTVMGVVKDFDVNLVRNKTIQELSEELWITSSRYWLAYTLIAISAWVNDNKALTDNAMSESYRVDKIKTSLFFCLMNLRFNRIDVAKQWLVEYFTTVVPEDVQDETAVLLQSYINGLFGADKSLEYEVKKVVDKWIDEINISEENNSELVEMFEMYITAELIPEEEYKREYISKYCENALDLEVPYVEAARIPLLINMIEAVDIENVVESAANFKARVDAVLKDLISNYDAEEEELKEQQKYFNYIIKNNGKEEIAEEQYSKYLEQKNQQHNIGKKFVEWALYDDNANVYVKKFSFQNTKVWFFEALNGWSSFFEEAFPKEYKIKIDDWSCTSNGEDAEEQEISLREHLEKNKLKIKYVNKPNKIMLVMAIIGIIISVLSGIAKAGANGSKFLLYVGLALIAVSVVVLIIRIILANSRFNKKVRASLGILSGVMTEIAEYRKGYFENLEKKTKLYSLLEHL